MVELARPARWLRRGALATGALALLVAAAADAAEVASLLVAGRAGAWFADLHESALMLAFPLLVGAASALLVAGSAGWGKPGARRAMMAAPLFAAGAIVFAPFFDARSLLVPEDARPLSRLPVLLMAAGGALVLSWRQAGARGVAFAGIVALLLGAAHATLRMPALGPAGRVPVGAYEAAWGALAWTLLAVALTMALRHELRMRHRAADARTSRA